MKNFKNVFLYLLLSILPLTSFSQVPKYVDTNGLVSWYEFNGNLKDEHTGDSLNKTGVVYFNKDSVYLVNGGKVSKTISNTSNISISTWINPKSTGVIQSEYNILSINDNNIIIKSWYPNVPKDDKSEFFRINSSDDNKKYLNPKDWVNLTVTISDSSRVYINGIWVKSFLKIANINSVSIGGSNGSIISMDNLGIWNKKLSLEKIKDLYNKSVADTSKLSISSSTNTISVYPNPTSDYIVIDNNDYQSKLSVNVYNSLGEIVFSSNITESKFKIDVTDFKTNGIYFVNITKDGNFIDTKKVLVNKNN